MADFCKECSELMFGKDFEEFAGLTTEEDTANGLYAEVLCEDCGVILVDHTGTRIGPKPDNPTILSDDGDIVL